MDVREFIRRHFFLRVSIPIVLGIILSRYYEFPAQFSILFSGLFLFLISCFLWISSLNKSYSLRSICGVLTFLFCFFFSTWRFQQVNANMRLIDADSSNYYLLKLDKDIQEKLNSYFTVASVSHSFHNKNWRRQSAKTVLYFQKDSAVQNLQIGDFILAKIKLQQVKNAGNPHEFDYAFYLQTQHVLYTAYLDGLSWKKYQKSQRFSILSQSVKWRRKLLQIYKQNGIEGDSFDILAALTLGDKSTLEPELKKAWANAGAMHVLAVSGLHVGIIYLVMNFLLQFLNKKKWGRFLKGILLLLVLWMYALLTGMSPSVMRASCMFSFIVIGSILNRRGIVINSLLASAAFLLIIDPYLLFTVGFQFSYLAVLGIVIIQPHLSKLLHVPNKVLNYFWQLTTVGFAAQLATFPLSVYYFNQFPTYFLLSGYVVISMAGILIYLSAFLLLFSPFSFVAGLLGKVLQFLVDVMNDSIHWIQNLPNAKVYPLVVDQYQVLLFYLIVISLLFLCIGRQKRAIYYLLTFMLLLQIPSFFQKEEAKLIVFNAQRNVAIAYHSNEQMHICVDSKIDSARLYRIITPYLVKEKVKQIILDTLHPIDVRVFENKKLLFLSKKVKRIDTLLNLIKPNVVIVSKYFQQNKICKILDKNQTVILDASLYPKYRKKWEDELILNQLRFFNVNEKGACQLFWSLE